MNKRFIITLILTITTIFCQALNFDKKRWYDFEGNLDGVAIQLSIYIPENGNVLKGNYCYKKYETRIQLVGQLKDDQIELTEFIDNKPNGHFIGRVFTDDKDRFEGTWTDSWGTKQLKFQMTLASSCYSDSWKQRYSGFSGTDEEVENFMKKVKLSIAKGDKEWVANHIRYPLTTTINGQKKIKVTNKQQLINNFEQIFYPEYKEKLKKTCVCNMFTNDKGVMLGDGEIWIGNNLADKKNSYQIIAINN